MTEILIPVVGLLGIIVGDALSLSRSRNEALNERRYKAIDSTLNAFMCLYRSCIFWANSGDNYSAVEKKVIQKFNWYTDVYYGNSVWLDQATDKKFNHLNKELVAFGNTLSMEID
ncbi:MAG: hypothetical protein ACR2GU_13905, partial [Rubrobacteraceae bacterium]